MRVLAIYRHYWPDATPYARLLKSILEEQVCEGQQATVLCAQPSYNDIKFARQPLRETIGGVAIHRVALLPERKRLTALRAFNFLYFLARAVVHVVVMRKYDVIIANTHPPILMGLALRIIKLLTGTPYILHVQDIHPESAVLAKQLKASWLVRLLKKIDTGSYRRALRVVTLSEDMAQTLLQRDPTLASKITVLNNFGVDDNAPTGCADHVDNAINDQFQILFAGNIGRFQGLAQLVKALAVLGDKLPIEVVFMGAGSEVSQLQTLVQELGVKHARFVSYQRPEIATLSLKRANLGIVSLMNGGCGVAYPSKTMGYVTSGCPILAIVGPETQLAREVVQFDLGYVAAGNSPDEIADALRHAFHDRHRWTQVERRELASRGLELFGEKQAMRKWNRLFTDVESALVDRSRQRTESYSAPKAA